MIGGCLRCSLPPSTIHHRAHAELSSIRNWVARTCGPFGAVSPRTHHLCALTCGYVVGSDLVGVRRYRFPQVRTIGVQVGFRSRNDNDSGKASLRLRGTCCPERGSGTLNQPARRGPTSRLRPVSYTHLRAHETRHDLVCRLLLEKK